MDFGFSLARVLRTEGPITTISASTLSSAGIDARNKLAVVIDEIGNASARAQGLKTPITSYSRLAGSDHRLYLLHSATHALGIIKVGVKRLFIRDMAGNIHEISPLCVLDFYVHESCQRKGYGLQLFKHMVAEERVSPSRLGYDRPSPKFLGFLRKHYNLAKYVPQTTNMVVFDKYFRPPSPIDKTRSSLSPSSPSRRQREARRSQYREERQRGREREAEREVDGRGSYGQLGGLEREMGRLTLSSSRAGEGQSPATPTSNGYPPAPASTSSYSGRYGYSQTSSRREEVGQVRDGLSSARPEQGALTPSQPNSSRSSYFSAIKSDSPRWGQAGPRLAREAQDNGWSGGLGPRGDQTSGRGRGVEGGAGQLGRRPSARELLQASSLARGGRDIISSGSSGRGRGSWGGGGGGGEDASGGGTSGRRGVGREEMVESVGWEYTRAGSRSGMDLRRGHVGAVLPARDQRSGTDVYGPGSGRSGMSYTLLTRPF